MIHILWVILYASYIRIGKLSKSKIKATLLGIISTYLFYGCLFSVVMFLIFLIFLLVVSLASWSTYGCLCGIVICSRSKRLFEMDVLHVKKSFFSFAETKNFAKFSFLKKLFIYVNRKNKSGSNINVGLINSF